MYAVGESLQSDQAMRLALEVAKEGRGLVSPNPLVGCVIVDHQHRFLAAAAHLKFGEAHAEINALNKIADKSLLKNATLYVTLEPCSHQGKTGPCAQALAQLPIQKVFYGCLDPNPQVAGRGLEILKKHGKVVLPFDRYQQDCQDLIEDFAFHIVKRQPYIVLKVATSLDGKIALATGESQWITSEPARVKGRELRAHYDATLIGSGTLRYDDPSLDFRDTAFAERKKNRVIILDSKGKVPEVFAKSKVAQLHERKNIYVLTRKEHVGKWAPHLVQVVVWESTKAGWETALQNLYQKGIGSIYVEGGSYAFSQLLQFQLAQKLYLFQSPLLIGEGVGWSQYFQNKTLKQAPRLKRWESIPLGEDRLNVAYF